MASIAIIGAGSVGKAAGSALSRSGHNIVFGVRDPADQRHEALGPVAHLRDAAAGASIALLAVPAAAVSETVPLLELTAGQILIDATNAVGSPVPGGFATMGDLVASVLPDGVHLAKGFNTIGAEHLGNGHTARGAVFLPIAGDPPAADAATALGTDLGFEVVTLGGRERFAMVEEHARLWIHLAFGCGWGRTFAFTAVRT